MGGIRPVEGDGGEAEAGAGRGRAPAARGDPAGGHVDRDRVGPSRHEGRGQGHPGGCRRRRLWCPRRYGTMTPGWNGCGGPAIGRRANEQRRFLAASFWRTPQGYRIWSVASRILLPPPLWGRDGEGGVCLILRPFYPPPPSPLPSTLVPPS